VFVLAGCGGNDAAEQNPAEQNPAEQAGCNSTSPHEESTDELYVRELFICTKDSMLYTFNNSEARDQWREAAETFGVIVIDEGDTRLDQGREIAEQSTGCLHLVRVTSCLVEHEQLRPGVYCRRRRERHHDGHPAL
jgi:hypothetical protein